MKLKEYAAAYPAFYESGVTVETVGSPGVGKTDIAQQCAANMSKILGKPFGFASFVASTFDTPDVRGFLLPGKLDGAETLLRRSGSVAVATWTLPSWFPTAASTKTFVDGKHVPGYPTLPEHGMILFDEVGQASQDLQKALSPVFLDGGYGDYKLPPTWRVTMASNRVQDKAGVQRRLSMLQNRALTIQIEADPGDWRLWAIEHGVHPLVIQWVRDGGTPFAAEVPAEPGPFLTPRSLTLLDKVLRAMARAEGLEDKLPTGPLAVEAAGGLIGMEAAVKLISYLKVGSELIPVDEILAAADPVRLRKPPVHLSMAQAGVLAARATTATAGVFMRYLSGMENRDDAQLYFVKTVGDRATSFMLVKEVAEWIMKNPRYQSQFTRA